MVLLTQEHFVSTIEAIRMQLHKDYAYADAVSTLFNTDSIGTYDNSILIKQLISLLQMYFPRDKEGFCDIEHYCFELNFGKCGGQELITAEDLYYRLVQKMIDNDVERQLILESSPKFDPSVFGSGFKSMKKDASELVALCPKPHSKEVDFFNIREACSKEYFKRASINEHLVSTHPLIDDYQFKKTEVIGINDEKELFLGIVERLKKQAINQRNSNKPYGENYDENNRRYCRGKIHAFEEIERELKKQE